MSDTTTRTVRRILSVAAAAAAILLFAGCEEPPILQFFVTSTVDAPDADPGDGICEATVGAGDCTLRAAIDEANTWGGVTGIHLAADETYLLTRAGPYEDDNDTGDLDIHQAIWLDGNGSTVDAEQLDRVFDVHAGGLVAGHLTVTGGEVVAATEDDRAHGGGIRSAAGLVLVQAEVTANRVDDDVDFFDAQGGGISGSAVTLTDTTVSDNDAVGDSASRGGGVYATDLVVSDGSMITGNAALAFEAYGGGIWAEMADVTDSSVDANVLDFDTQGADLAYGAGIYAPDLVVGGSTVDDNTMRSMEGGEGVGIRTTRLTMADTSVSGNEQLRDLTDTLGGGVYAVSDPDVDPASTVTDSTITGNQITSTNPADRDLQGGGMYLGNASVSDTTVSNNASDLGGGILAARADVTLTRVSITDNTAHAEGGGIAHAAPSGTPPGYSGQLRIEQSLISGNTATQAGGLLDSTTDDTDPPAEPSTLVAASTFSGNDAGNTIFHMDSFTGVGGGAIVAGSGAWVVVSESTITDNVAVDDLGGPLAAVRSGSADSVSLQSSVVADQAGGTVDCSGTMVSSGHNLDSDGTCGLGDPTDQSGVDPLLGPLADNGGPTLTHLPAVASPLLDHVPVGVNGCGTLPDQRGVARPQGTHCDIGAVEVEP